MHETSPAAVNGSCSRFTERILFLANEMVLIPLQFEAGRFAASD